MPVPRPPLSFLLSLSKLESRKLKWLQPGHVGKPPREPYDDNRGGEKTHDHGFGGIRNQKLHHSVSCPAPPRDRRPASSRQARAGLPLFEDGTRAGSSAA